MPHERASEMERPRCISESGRTIMQLAVTDWISSSARSSAKAAPLAWTAIASIEGSSYIISPPTASAFTRSAETERWPCVEAAKVSTELDQMRCELYPQPVPAVQSASSSFLVQRRAPAAEQMASACSNDLLWWQILPLDSV